MLKFANEIAELVKEQLGVDVEVSNITKCGDMKKTALVFKKQGVCPNIYIDDLFFQYKKGIFDKKEIVSEVINLYNESEWDVKSDDIFSRVSLENVIPVLLNKEKNVEYLSDVVTYKIPNIDTVVVAFQIIVEKSADGRKTLMVTNGMKEKFFKNVSISEIYKNAVKNMDFCLKDMETVMMEIVYEKENRNYIDSCNVDFSENNIYVLSNSDYINGASCILNTEKMKKIEEKNGSFYIIPSSIHECLLVGKNISKEELNQMVCEVNTNEVRVEEQLDDRVYLFENGVLKVA